MKISPNSLIALTAGVLLFRSVQPAPTEPPLTLVAPPPAMVMASPEPPAPPRTVPPPQLIGGMYGAHAKATLIAASDTSGVVVTATAAGEIRVWDTARQALRWRACGAPIAALRFEPEGDLLVESRDADGEVTLRRWDIRSGECRGVALRLNHTPGGVQPVDETGAPIGGTMITKDASELVLVSPRILAQKFKESMWIKRPTGVRCAQAMVRAPYQVALALHGGRIAMASERRLVVLHPDERVLTQRSLAGPYELSISEDGQYVALVPAGPTRAERDTLVIDLESGISRTIAHGPCHVAFVCNDAVYLEGGCVRAESLLTFRQDWYSSPSTVPRAASLIPGGRLALLPDLMWPGIIVGMSPPSSGTFLIEPPLILRPGEPMPPPFNRWVMGAAPDGSSVAVATGPAQACLYATERQAGKVLEIDFGSAVHPLDAQRALEIDAAGTVWMRDMRDPVHGRAKAGTIPAELALRPLPAVTPRHQARVRAAPTGRYLLCGTGQGDLDVVEYARGSSRPVPGDRAAAELAARWPREAAAAVWAPDGESFFCMTARGVIERLGVLSFDRRGRFESIAAPVALAISPDGRWLAAGGEDGALAVWDVSTGRLVWRDAAPDVVTTLALTADGHLRATTADPGVLDWQLGGVLR